MERPLSFDTTRRYVRVTGERPDGFVEFDFAVGEPEIFVEMILPPAAFAEFCHANRVERLDAAAGEGGADDWNWRLADATRTRFKPQ
ncbi:phenol hydroxylase subunit [Azoarcus olearius]|uniref:Phenol 2-monooxygenase n=1 Tax=Azoarcus sp. (strain BH72) TaxID=418699 RepID=A1K6K7_AZOSB|nr:phenol hydroxylase subunit [Azoarcus olearius]CAL94462.1 phenol 2-monooxygenase [Azoarcus olearius]